VEPPIGQTIETEKERSALGENFLHADLLSAALVSPVDFPEKVKGVDQGGLLTFPPAFNLDFVERLLGKKEEELLSRSTRRRLDSLYNQIPQFLDSQVSYSVQKIGNNEKGIVTLDGGIELKSAKLAYALKKAHAVVGFIATVGRAVDKQIDTMMASNKLADAYVVDALGSGAVEHLAETFQNHIADRLKQYGLGVGLRFSPGYCDWPVSEQKKLFSFVEADPVDVSLEETALMRPRKSISAVFGIYEEHVAPALDKHNPCRLCAKKDCLARRASRKTPT
jgi:hypothetical protein